MPEQRYTVGRRHLLRWDGSSAPAKVPKGLEVLTERGWIRVGVGVRGFLWQGRKAFSSAEAVARARRACGSHGVHESTLSGARAWFSGCALRWMVSPPLALGAPRRGLKPAEGISSFVSELGPGVTESLASEALAGYERARDRQLGIEARATQFLQAAGLTTTLVLANAALLRGDSRVQGFVGTLLVVVLLIGSLALITASVYGVYATMYTFSRVAPNVPRRLLARSKVTGDASARRQYVAALLLAQRRTSLVADWKLARLKRAAAAFLVAIACVAIASCALVLDATSQIG